MFILLSSCLPEGYSEETIELSKKTLIHFKNYENKYGAEKLELVHLKIQDSVNTVLIRIINARDIQENHLKRKEASKQIAEDIFQTLDSTLISEVLNVDLYFEFELIRFLSYNKTRIHPFSFMNDNGDLIPLFMY